MGIPWPETSENRLIKCQGLARLGIAMSPNRYAEPGPLSVGALVFLGPGLLLAVGHAIPWRKNRWISRETLRPTMPEGCRHAHSGQGDLPPKFFRQERKGLKIRVPAKTPCPPLRAPAMPEAW